MTGPCETSVWIKRVARIRCWSRLQLRCGGELLEEMEPKAGNPQFSTVGELDYGETLKEVGLTYGTAMRWLQVWQVG